MERLECDWDQCEDSAQKFCINCKKYLCKTHKIEDMTEQQIKSLSEHNYIDAFEYRCNEGRFIPIYCEKHLDQILTQRCINCFQCACDLCLPQWCTKAPGRYHDYDKIINLVGSYIDKVYELFVKLQNKHELFLMNLEEACRNHDKTKLDLEELINKIDRADEFQIAAVTEEGEKLKEAIIIEMSQADIENTNQISSIEKKAEMSRQLLRYMCEIKDTVGGILAVHNYCWLKIMVSDLITWKMPTTASSKFMLRQDKKTEIMHVESYMSEKQIYGGVNFISRDKVSFLGRDWLSGNYFTETMEGKTLVIHQTFPYQVLQLLPYGDQLLMLIESNSSGTEYSVRLQDNGTALYEFTDSDYSRPYYSHKHMAVTSDHQLVVLQRKTQNIHVKHLKTNVEMDLTLYVGMNVDGVLASSDDNLILLCVTEDKEQETHSLMKYDLKLQKVVWHSDCLLTVSRTEKEGQLEKDRPMRVWLNVAGYLDHLYVIKRHKPKSVIIVNLSDGHVKEETSCDALPDDVLDISLRGSILATASDERIGYFRITDITEIM